MRRIWNPEAWTQYETIVYDFCEKESQKTDTGNIAIKELHTVYNKKHIYIYIVGEWQWMKGIPSLSSCLED